MQEQIFSRFVNLDKVPFTDPGGTMIENEMRSVLSQATTNGGVDGYTVRVPKVLEVPTNQRAAREFGNCTFEARLAGAMSKVIIRGNVFP